MKYNTATYVGIKNGLQKVFGAVEKPLEYVPQVTGGIISKGFGPPLC